MTYQVDPYRGLNGAVALVAGASRGIGRGIALELAERGARVVGTSRDGDQAHELARLLGTPLCVLDVTDPMSVQQAIGTITETLGPVRALVNNAGVNVPAPFLDVAVKDWDRILTTNARGPFLTSQAVARTLHAHRLGGAIVFVGSQAGLVGIEERAAYCASKAALLGLTRVMAIELAAFDITANCVAPTFVETELTRSTLARPDMRDRFLSRVPAQRFARVEDVVGAVSFLLSEQSRMITGQALAVDGGWTTW
ncbi:SDR family NAD(P)-dependent oxidoreductase [Dactylosporangium darangshiense]|uniref:SDR family oxidoreductase n=1 Tax=Dactylosporangium darangshiense TaxID=579108 RepID=A0ABP8DWF7_9ACTN